MPSNAVARQHRAHPLRDLANCGKLHMASVCDGLEFKPHLRGSWGNGPNQHKRAVPRRGHGAKSLTSTGMLPHCVHEGPSTLGLNQWKTTSPPGCDPHCEVPVYRP